MRTGCTFADMDTFTVIYADRGAVMSFVSCLFEDNIIRPFSWGAAVIEADHYNGGEDGSPRYNDTLVRLEGCSFRGNLPSAMPILLADRREDVSARAEALFYSDLLTPSVCSYEGPVESAEPPPCVFNDPLPLNKAGGSFLTLSDMFMKEVLQVFLHPLNSIWLCIIFRICLGGYGCFVVRSWVPCASLP
jgi:hypothetical protein